MIRIENFENMEASGITYGGYSGSKKELLLRTKDGKIINPLNT